VYDGGQNPTLKSLEECLASFSGINLENTSVVKWYRSEREWRVLKDLDKFVISEETDKKNEENKKSKKQQKQQKDNSAEKNKDKKSSRKD